MQPITFVVKGLFGRFDYEIPLKGSRPYQEQLPIKKEVAPSIVILYGTNGSGKTTVLRMIDGFLKLDFNVFRSVPFTFAELRFNTGNAISVWPESDKEKAPLTVRFEDSEARLNPVETGPYSKDDFDDVNRFRDISWRVHLDASQTSFSIG